jgi:hypothetical protein
MTTLRIASGGPLGFELACVSAGRFALWRQGGDVRLTLDDRHATEVRRALAFRGVRATPCEGGVPDPPRLLAAIGTGLAPADLAGSDELDLIEVRVLPLGEATARLMKRPFGVWPGGPRRRARCRALLHGNDAALEVRRSAWCGRSTLGRARHALRPVLFDRAATPRAQWIYAADGALTRWISG